MKLKNKKVTILTHCDGSMQVRYGKTGLKIIKDRNGFNRAPPPRRAGYKDLTAIMNRLIPDHGRFVDLSIEGTA